MFLFDISDNKPILNNMFSRYEKFMTMSFVTLIKVFHRDIKFLISLQPSIRML